MLNDSLPKLYRKVLLTQALATLGVAIVAFIFADFVAAQSAAAGGSAALLGGGLYALVARESKLNAASASQVFARHILAEASKVVVIAIVTLCALATGWFVAGWLVAGLVVALLGHGLAVFIIR